MTRSSGGQPSEREIEDVASLADGSLPPRRRAEVEARVAASRELTELLGEQRRARDAVRRLPLAAPPGLRARIDAERRQATLRRRRRGRTGAAAIAAAAVAGLAIVRRR